MWTASQITSSFSMTIITFALIYYYARKYAKRYCVKDKIILITGACSEGGLGMKLAVLAKTYGAKTIIVTSRNENSGLNCLKYFESIEGPGQVVHVTLDLNWSHEQIEKVVRDLWSRFGRIDVIIANAGVSYRGEICKTSNDVCKNLMQSNYFGNVALISTAVKLMQPTMNETNKEDSTDNAEITIDDGYYIVGVTSIQGRISIPYRSAYSASKHAFSAFLDCLRAEAKAIAANSDNQTCIRVLNVIPSYIKTNLSKNALRDTGVKHSKMDETTEKGMSPDEVALSIFSSIRCGKDELLLLDTKSTIALYLRTVFPSLYFKIMNKRAAKSSAY